MTAKISKGIWFLVDSVLTVVLWVACLSVVMRYILGYVNAYMLRYMTNSGASEIQFYSLFLLPFIALNVVVLYFVCRGLIKITKILFKKSFEICNKWNEKALASEKDNKAKISKKSVTKDKKSFKGFGFKRKEKAV